jgi:hypothetical protein
MEAMSIAVAALAYVVAVATRKVVETPVEKALETAFERIPENNVYEQEILRAFGVQNENARTTEEALEMIRRRRYDLVISDMARHGKPDAGLELLSLLRELRNDSAVIYYVGRVDPSRGTPVGAFGIADRPEPLLHYVLDVLERARA